MLNARFGVVDFTGRTDELAQLHQWCQNGPRLAVRWLYSPGGQGKTRLAAQFGQELITARWKVITATHGPGAVLPPPGIQDMRPSGAAGLLAIVDYADRWPLTHLTWLFSNAVLHQSGVRTRVLMLARSADAWPPLGATLANHQAGTSREYLDPGDLENTADSVLGLYRDEIDHPDSNDRRFAELSVLKKRQLDEDVGTIRRLVWVGESYTDFPYRARPV
jgi:hypothetical protein